MSFAVSADAYDRFMGRYAVPLAPQLATLAEVTVGQRVLDVGVAPTLSRRSWSGGSAPPE